MYYSYYIIKYLGQQFEDIHSLVVAFKEKKKNDKHLQTWPGIQVEGGNNPWCNMFKCQHTTRAQTNSETVL